MSGFDIFIAERNKWLSFGHNVSKGFGPDGKTALNDEEKKELPGLIAAEWNKLRQKGINAGYLDSSGNPKVGTAKLKEVNDWEIDNRTYFGFRGDRGWTAKEITDRKGDIEARQAELKALKDDAKARQDERTLREETAQMNAAASQPINSTPRRSVFDLAETGADAAGDGFEAVSSFFGMGNGAGKVRGFLGGAWDAVSGFFGGMSPQGKAMSAGLAAAVASAWAIPSLLQMIPGAGGFFKNGLVSTGVALLALWCGYGAGSQYYERNNPVTPGSPDSVLATNPELGDIYSQVSGGNPRLVNGPVPAHP